MRDFVAFEEHVEGVVASVSGTSGVAPEWYEAPTFYFTNPYALIGAHDDVAVPPGSQLFDFELEVAVVVGADGSSLTPDQAPQHIFGYTILNDWSARDLQRREMKVNLGPAKGKDSATTLGPWLVTADELAEFVDDDGFLALDMRVWVNDELIGQDLLSNMGWPFAELISYASRGTWVRAGDVLGSGTCGNGGCLGELWGRRGQHRPAAPADRRRRPDDGRGNRHHRKHRRARPVPSTRTARSAAVAEPGPGVTANDETTWVSAWYAAPVRLVPADVCGRTFRQIVHPHSGGDQIRLHVSNRYGDEPVEVSSTSVARVMGGPIVQPGGCAVMFGGRPTLILRPGQEAVSDPVTFAVEAFADLAVTFFLAAGEPVTGHFSGRQTSFLSGLGDVSSAGGPDDFVHLPVAGHGVLVAHRTGCPRQRTCERTGGVRIIHDAGRRINGRCASQLA